ncbi:Beta-glucanase, GH16 family [Lachnospiraceae bacterium]|nr:Beta-glucanase, GH16 family [Lachnospiraceae bacterium]
MKKLLYAFLAMTMIVVTSCGIGSDSGSEPANGILSDTSTTAGAMQMYYYDGKTIKRRIEYDSKKEEKILEKIRSKEALSGNEAPDFKVPAYGIWSVSADGTDLYLAMSGNNWLTADGLNWNVETDPGQIWEMFDDSGETEVKSITEFPLQSQLVKYDTVFADKSASVDTTGLSDVQKDRVMVWHDEFDGTALNEDNWETVGSLESGNFDENSVKIENSVLHLKSTPLKEGATAGEWYDPVVIQNPDKGIRQGRIEARIKMDQVNGADVAFWTMGTGQWPLFGETDMFETYPDGTFASALHWSDGTPWNNSQIQPGWGSFDGQFHIYAFEMNGSNYTMYVDDRKLWSYDTSAASYYDGINPFENMQKVIKLNIGFMDKSVVISDAKEINMWIDWVREYAPKKINDPEKELLPKSVTLTYLGQDGRAKVSKDGKSAVMSLGDIAIFTPVYEPETVEQRGVIITSSDEDIAEPTGDFAEHSGLILGKKVGKTKLTVTDVKTGVKSTLELTVTDDADSKKTVSGSSIDSLNLGDPSYWLAHGVFDEHFSVIHTKGTMDVDASSKYAFITTIEGWADGARFMRVHFFDKNNKYINYAEVQPGDIFTTPDNAVTAVPEISWFTGDDGYSGTFYTQLMKKISSEEIRFYKNGSIEYYNALALEKLAAQAAAADQGAGQ